MSRGPDPKHPDHEVLEIFVLSTDPAFAVNEIADELGSDRETARNRLESLVERGYLDRKKPGQRTVMYWVTDDGKEYYARIRPD